MMDLLHDLPLLKLFWAVVFLLGGFYLLIKRTHFIYVKNLGEAFTNTLTGIVFFASLITMIVAYLAYSNSKLDRLSDSFDRSQCSVIDFMGSSKCIELRKAILEIDSSFFDEPVSDF